MRSTLPHCVRPPRSIVCTVAIAIGACSPAQEWRTVPQPRPRLMAAQAYDVARARTVLFGGMNESFERFGDSWEHDGSRWTRVVTANAPSARASAGMVYDLVRQRILLFGGSAGGEFADTWEFDGTNWTQRFPATSPSPRHTPGMAYDILRGRTVLYGGFRNTHLADTWEFDGTNWIARTTATAPPPNSGPISFDIVRARTVMLRPLGDTWLYDGQDWSQLLTPHQPTRVNFGQCYDLAHNRTVVLGGFDLTTNDNPDDVWLFDGGDWTRTVPTNGPPGRSFPSVSCDWSQRVLAFGGQGPELPVYGETWEWSQGTWRALHRTPSWRQNAAMVFDPLRDRMVLAGGNSINALFDTWECVGSNWTPIPTPTRPPPRSGHALVYDAARGRVTMFGGWGTTSPITYHGDTWFYDGTDWSPANPAASPSPRTLHAMVYDPVRRRVLLFGGYSPTQFYVAETWAFDGTNWSQLAPVLSPPARGRHALAYDARRDVVVLFGGLATFAFNDTWEFDGGNWTQRTNVGSPSSRFDHAMTYDAQAGCVLMCGGYANVTLALQDSWHYDGVIWTHLVPNIGPPPGGPHGLVCDITRGRLIAYDGKVGETWDYIPASVATAARFGIGCADGCGVPTLDAAPGSVPGIGAQFTLQVTSRCALPAGGTLAFGFDLARWNGAALPVDLAPIGLPGCHLWIAPLDGALSPLSFQGSVATFAVQVPAIPELAGLVVGAQAATIDAAGAGAVTNALVLRVF